MLMAADQSAATSSNMQTVSVIAVTDPEKKTRLAKTCAGQDFIANAPLLLCFVTDLARPARVASTIGADLFALPMIDTFLASISDCSIFAQNLVLAAESLGMGTCYVGSLRNRPDLVAQELNVPNGSAVLFGLCIGYESRERVTAVRPRLPQRAILHRESYNTDGEDEALAEYDAITPPPKRHRTGLSCRGAKSTATGLPRGATWMAVSG